jgi:hypothetical protein
MTKKTNPIEKHKEDDLKLGREKLLEVINREATNATMVKNMIEAVKLLARMHKALQVDKVIAKAEAKAGVAQIQLPPDEMAQLDAEVEEILGRETATIPKKAML